MEAGAQDHPRCDRARAPERPGDDPGARARQRRGDPRVRSSQQRYHVLYVSCHAAPGRLMLEDADGGADQVDGRAVLAGSSAGRPWRAAGRARRLLDRTRRAARKADEAKERACPALRGGWWRAGVPAVIAMQAPVSDAYATGLAGALFEALATWREPEPLRALAAGAPRARSGSASPTRTPSSGRRSGRRPRSTRAGSPAAAVRSDRGARGADADARAAARSRAWWSVRSATSSAAGARSA